MKADENKTLSAALEKAGVEHTALLLPGGKHTIDARVRHEARRFVRRDCAGKRYRRVRCMTFIPLAMTSAD